MSDGIVPVGEGRGIWYVQPSGGGRPFTQSGRPNIATYRNTKFGSAIRETVWRFGNIGTNKQIVLENVGDSPLADIRNVDFGVVRDFDSYGDAEEVVIPDGRADLLIQMCQAFLAKPYNDLSNNNQ